MQVCCGSFARTAQLGGTGGDEFALHDQASVIRRVENGDLQHWCFGTRDRGKAHAKLAGP